MKNINFSNVVKRNDGFCDIIEIQFYGIVYVFSSLRLA